MLVADGDAQKQVFFFDFRCLDALADFNIIDGTLDRLHHHFELVRPFRICLDPLWPVFALDQRRCAFYELPSRCGVFCLDGLLPERPVNRATGGALR